MAFRSRAWLASFAVVIAVVPFATKPAHAEEPPPPDAEDGFSACTKFQEKADKELDTWAKDQPKVPFKPEREETILGGPWVELTRAIAHSSGVIAATLIPSLGAQLRDSKPAPVISFPWSFQIGPALSCTREKGQFVVKRHIPNRIMLEPAIVPVGGASVAMWVRPGYRLLIHPSSWIAGFGGGIGSTIDLFGFESGKKKEPFRASISPEVVVHFGHCCDRGFFTLTVRSDIYLEGQDRFIIGGTAGYTYF
jgi:hypothetical protein